MGMDFCLVSNFRFSMPLRRGRRGAVTVLGALLIFPLLCILAFSASAFLLLTSRWQQYTAAEAAATAAVRSYVATMEANLILPLAQQKSQAEAAYIAIDYAEVVAAQNRYVGAAGQALVRPENDELHPPVPGSTTRGRAGIMMIGNWTSTYITVDAGTGAGYYSGNFSFSNVPTWAQIQANAATGPYLAFYIELRGRPESAVRSLMGNLMGITTMRPVSRLVAYYIPRHTTAGIIVPEQFRIATL